ncbi:hypothetical protein J1N35_027798 [Gossypium stocksii]|uniref:Uncharacterized protein n=1 Tax=Gossypium stocksii TaxID=47602 RepID=A0A9D3VAY7_9ROSI|nr:hypothetical protein J1N35_027798 [Gossypium stocksii]
MTSLGIYKTLNNNQHRSVMVHCFKTSLVGQQIVVSTDPDVNHFIFHQEGKLVQSWYMDKFDDCWGFLEASITDVGKLCLNSRPVLK